MESWAAGNYDERVDRKAAVAHQPVVVTVTPSLGKDSVDRVAGKVLQISCFDSNRDLMGGNLYMASSPSHTHSVCTWHGCCCKLQQRDLLVLN